MIDVHAHFAEEGYEFPAEWEKIKAAGVGRVILAADTLEHAAWHAKFCEEHEGAFFTVGVHPEFAAISPRLPLWGELTPKAAEEEIVSHTPLPWESGGGVWEGGRPRSMDEETFLSLARLPKCVAVGEIGLDYHYSNPDKTAQRAAFEAQLKIAEELSLPVQIHSRDACEDTLSIIRENRFCLTHGFVMHCYSYGAENLEAFLGLGAYFSFGGVVCFKNARRAVEAVELCPMDRILSETDSPYLSPFRGEKNTPANIPIIVEKLAKIKGVSCPEMIETIRANAARLFPKLP